MFTNANGVQCSDAEQIAETIRAMLPEEVQALGSRRAILADALRSFEMRIGSMTAIQRDATLSLLYQKFANLLFDFHLSIEVSAAREHIHAAPSKTMKRKALECFRARAEDLAMLYSID